MRVQLHWIARIHVVYLKQVDPRTSLMNPLPAEPPWSTEKKCRAGAKNSSRKKGLIEPGSLRGSLTYTKTNSNLIEKNSFFLYTFPSSIATAGLTQSIGSYRYPNIGHRKDLGQFTKARKPASES